MRLPLSLLLVSLTAAPARAEDPPAVLYVGDSHSAQFFGRALDGQLRAQKGRVATFAVAGSAPSSWLSEEELPYGFMLKGFDGKSPAKWLRTREETRRRNGKDAKVTIIRTPRFADLVAEYKPAAVIVALGSNGATAASVKALVDAIHGAHAGCFWIGPPRMRTVSSQRLDGVYAVLAAQGIATAGDPGKACRLIDSRSFSYLKYPAEGCDGIHYNCPGLSELGTRWGRDAYAAFAAALSP